MSDDSPHITLEELKASHLEANKKTGHTGMFFERKDMADDYARYFRKHNPFRICEIYPLRHAVTEIDRDKMFSEGFNVDEELHKRRVTNLRYKILEYKLIGYLVSTPTKNGR